MADHTILIPGGLGFIGSHTAIHLASLGYSVAIVDNLSRPTPNVDSSRGGGNFTRNMIISQHPEITIFTEDLRDNAAVKAIFLEVNPDAVIYAAGQTSAVGSVVDPHNDFTNNVNALFNTLECARTTPSVSQFLYLSTNKVYGLHPNQFSLTEDSDRYTPTSKEWAGVDESLSIDQTGHTPYGVSKLAGDLYVQEYGQLYDFHTNIFRLSCVYGPRQFGFEEQGWIAHFIIQALLNRPISIFGTGKQVRDVLYISDLTQLISTYLEKVWDPTEKGSIPSSEVFNVGGGSNNTISLNELLHFLQEDLKKSMKVINQDWRPSDQKYFVSDIGKITQFTGWTPKITPFVGIRHLITWIKAHLELFME